MKEMQEIAKSNPVSVREGVLEAAKEIVCGDRDKMYGEPEDSFRVIGDLWTAYLIGCGTMKAGESITPDMVGWMMVLFKAGRAATAEEQSMDTYVDAAGYAACAAEAAFRRGD